MVLRCVCVCTRVYICVRVYACMRVYILESQVNAFFALSRYLSLYLCMCMCMRMFVQVRVYTPPGKTHLGTFSLDVATRALHFYNGACSYTHTYTYTSIHYMCTHSTRTTDER